MIGDSLTTEQLEYIKNHYGSSNKAIADGLYETFGVSMHPQNIGRILSHRFGIKAKSNIMLSFDGAEEFFRLKYLELGKNAFTEAFNEKFGTSFKVSSARYCANRLGIFERDDRFRPDEEEWIIENANKHSTAELTRLYNEKFCRNKKEGNITAKCSNLGIGVSTKEEQLRLQKENIQKYLKETGKLWNLGEIREFKNGYEFIKVSERGEGNYVITRAKYEYEKAYGVKPKKGELVIFLDGNLKNYAKDNLALVSKNVSLKMNRYQGGCKGRPAELNKAYVTAYQIDEIISKETKCQKKNLTE